MSLYDIIAIQDELLRHLDFEEASSVNSAKKVITAGKRWLVLSPNSSSSEGNSMALNVEQVQEMVERAQNYVSANTTDDSHARVRFLSVQTGFRGR